MCYSRLANSIARLVCNQIRLPLLKIEKKFSILLSYIFNKIIRIEYKIFLRTEIAEDVAVQKHAHKKQVVHCSLQTKNFLTTSLV